MVRPEQGELGDEARRQLGELQARARRDCVRPLSLALSTASRGGDTWAC